MASMFLFGKSHLLQRQLKWHYNFQGTVQKVDLRLIKDEWIKNEHLIKMAN